MTQAAIGVALLIILGVVTLVGVTSYIHYYRIKESTYIRTEAES